MASRGEALDFGETRGLFQALTFCARLVVSDLVEEIDESYSDDTHSDFRFTIQRGNYTYRAQLICYDAQDFAVLYLFPDLLCEPEDAPVAYELASRLNDFLVVGAFSVNPSKNTGIYFRSWRWLDKNESEIRCVRNLLNGSDYSLKVFEQAYKYWREWGITVEDAVMTAGF